MMACWHVSVAVSQMRFGPTIGPERRERRPADRPPGGARVCHRPAQRADCGGLDRTSRHIDMSLSCSIVIPLFRFEGGLG